MNRFDGRGPTRFGYSNDRDDRSGGLQGGRDERGPGFGRDRGSWETRSGNWGGPTQGDYRGGYPSNGPDRGWGSDERYRDREGRFGTTYGMSQVSENRELRHTDDDHGDFRDADRDVYGAYGYQDHEGWGGRGLEEVRGATGHHAYDPRYSRQDARKFGGQQRFGQGWEADRFASRGHTSSTIGGYERDGSFGASMENRFDSRYSGRFPMGLGSFETGSGDVRPRSYDRGPGGERGRSGERDLGGLGGAGGAGVGGRGPKGYQRSDERIREDICELLSRQGRIDASEVDVVVTKGEVTLTGTVMQRGDKLEIEHIVEHVSGVKDVRNEIRRATFTSGQSGGTGHVTSAPSPGGTSGASGKDRENGTKSPSTRHSS